MPANPPIGLSRGLQAPLPAPSAHHSAAELNSAAVDVARLDSANVDGGSVRARKTLRLGASSSSKGSDCWA
jgi:hypothetical protein